MWFPFVAIIIAASLYLVKEPTRSWLVFGYGICSGLWLSFVLHHPWAALAVFIVCGMQASALIRRNTI